MKKTWTIRIWSSTQLGWVDAYRQRFSSAEEARAAAIRDGYEVGTLMGFRQTASPFNYALVLDTAALRRAGK